MVTRKGLADAIRYMDQLPGQIERKLLRGAGKAAIEVVADEARLRAHSAESRSSVHTAVKSKSGRVHANLQTKGPGAFIALWEEWGTEPHYISVKPEAREGRSIGRINRLAKEGSLVINGNFVGASVFHPGAKAHPFVRPAFDAKQEAAFAAAQAFVSSRVTPRGIVGSDEPGDES